MEENRLSTLSPTFNHKLFNELYTEISPLIKSISSQINPDLFPGWDREDVKAALTIKFLFVFQKYSEQSKRGVLKGQLINSLTTYKFRLIRNGMAKKNEIHHQSSGLEEVFLFGNEPIEDSEAPDDRISQITSFIKSQVSSPAYNILLIELDPPPYILEKMHYIGFRKTITTKLLADYLGISSKTQLEALESWRRELNIAKKKCKEYFS